MQVLRWKAFFVAGWFFVGLVGWPGTGHAQSCSSSGGYANCRTITIDHTKVPNTDQTDFPLAFSGTYSYLASTSHGGGATNANGYDIIFTSDSAGTTMLPFEQESYNSSTGAVNYWIQIPTLSHTSDTVIYLFYGNSSVTTNQSNPTGTWDSNYQGVWHFANGSTLSLSDSTAGGNNGTGVNSPGATAGKLDGGMSVNNSNSYMTASNSTSLGSGGSITASTWINTSSLNSSAQSQMMDKSTWSSNGFTLGDNGPYNGSVIYFRVLPAGNSGSCGTGMDCAARSLVNDGNWHYIVGVYNGSTVKLYVDSVLEDTETATSFNPDTSNPLAVGALAGGSGSSALDEVRFSNTARSADWITSEYNNQSSPFTFYNEGSPAITSLSESPLHYGDSITITGRNFGSSQGSSTLTFAGVTASVTSWSDTSIVATVPIGISAGAVVATVSGATSNSESFSVLPSSWLNGDIGSVGLSGSTSFANGSYTLQGAGSDIYGSSDSFQFAYQSLSGDGTIVARVVSMTGGGGYPKAGVMIRESLNANSANASTLIQSSNTAMFSYRGSTGSGTNQNQQSVTLPYWVKMVRSGSTFTAYSASDGVNWSQIGSTQTISMATNVYIGLAVTSNTTSSSATDVFDNVSISSSAAPAPVISGISATTGSVGEQLVLTGTDFGTTQSGSLVLLNGSPMTVNSWSASSITVTIPSSATSGYLAVSVAPTMDDSNPIDFTVTSHPLPSSWLDQDVGTLTLAGSAGYSNGTFTVKGAGSGISGSGDTFHFVYQPWSGDGTIVARVVSVSDALYATYAQAGVMIRETLTSGSTMAYNDFQNAFSNSAFAYRSTTGGSTSTTGPTGTSLPYWVMLTRSGSTFTSYISSDGVNWTQEGSSETISMASNVYIGLAVTSANSGNLVTATFDNVSITSTSAPAPLITGISATTGSVGEQIIITGTGFGSSQGTSAVLLNDLPASIGSWSATSITMMIPTGATSGDLVVAVAPSMNSSNPIPFEVTSSPLPISWLDQDVGLVGLAGSASYSSGTFTVNAAGNGFNSTADSFHFVYQPISGDATIVARVVTIGSGSYAEAGVMVRETLTPGSAMVFNRYDGSAGNSSFVYRSSTGASTNATGPTGTSLAYWVMITRSGNLFTSYISSDGVNWTQEGSSETITMASNVYIGLAVTSSSTTSLVTATLDNVVISPSAATIVPVISSLTPPAAPAGGTVTLAGTDFGSTQSSSVVDFNSVPASIVSWSNTSVTVTVPSSAASGSVTVTVGGVPSNAVSFSLIEALSITGISPSAAPIGSSVIITGTGFGPTQSNSTLGFYGSTTAPSITSWSDTSIEAVVPADASTGSVSVTVANNATPGSLFYLTTGSTLTDSLGNVTLYAGMVDGGQWVFTSSDGSGCSTCTSRGVISNTYDTQGNQLSTTDALSNTTTLTYDTANDLLTKTAPINSTTNAVTTYTYNSFGEVLTATDALGNVTTNAYDTHGNLTSVTTPAPGGGPSASVTSFTYNSLGELTQITDPLGHATAMTYTTAGLIASTTDAQSHVTSYTYDSAGNRTSVTDPLGHETTFAYDAGNRLTTITYPDMTTTTFTYDIRGRRTSVTDQNGKVTTYAYDGADRLASVTDAASNATTYAYDTEDNLTGITDANSHATYFTYDAYGRVTQTNFPSSSSETYGYDANNNLTSKTDRNGHTIDYVYDDLNRLTQKNYPDSTSVEYTYDLVGKVTQVTDPTGTYSFAYDNMGRLVGTTTSYSFLTGRNFTTSYSYDAASNRTGFTDPESGSTSYSYDTLNRLTTLAPPSAFGSGSFGFSYDAASRRTQMTRPNSVATNYGYDTLSRLTSVLHQLSGSTIDGESYTLDYAGNRTAKNDHLAGLTSNYTYDSLYELTQVAQGTTTTESYSYDPVGNRTASLGVSSYTANSSNELTATSSASYTYDYNGNTLTKAVGSDTTTYTWDYENHLTSVALPGSGGTVSFKYDPMGRRIYKSSSSSTSVFAYDGNNLIEETNSSGTAVARYSQAQNIDEPLAILRSGVTSYYNADGLGSITSLTNSSGAATQTYTYDSFGKVTASSGSLTNPFQYTGRESDAETGLYYYRARYYDPAVGRFTAEDPVRSPLRTNLYPYVRNSSPNRIDSSGMTDQPPVPSGAFGKNHGCSLVGISEVTLWTSKSGRVPTSNWTFVTSTQEGAGDYDPVSTITCIWERTYSAEVYGHVLTTYTYHCWSNSCFGYSQWTDHEFKWSVKDLGQVTGTERTTTTFGGFGAEDETNDILCVTKPLLRPNP